MADSGSRVDWGGDSWVKPSKKLSADSPFSSLLKRNKMPSGRKNNNKATGFVVRNNGGNIGQKTISGTSGLLKTLVDRPVNMTKNSTAHGSKTDGGAPTKRTQLLYKGGGVPSKAVVQARPSAVKVQPVKPKRG